MTWLDITLLVVAVLFLAVGAKFGSLWTSACLLGGFLGAFLVDYYALPLAGLLGQFPGSPWVAAALLFTAGLVAAMVPGYILSRLFSGAILGLLDSALGLLTGAWAAFVAITLFMLFVGPYFPSLESTRAWKRSEIVRPLHLVVENLFSDSHFSSPGFRLALRKGAGETVAEDALRTGNRIKQLAQSVEHKF